MLIEFSVENFRSIRSRQTLSMVAAPRLQKKNNTITAEIDGERAFPPLLKVVAIYGPNASGKSTLIKALQVLHTLTQRKPSAVKEPFPVAPFRFDPTLRDKPSVFEVHFIENRVRYSFQVSLTSERIVHECLTVYEKGLPYGLYERKHIDGQDTYQFDDRLEGGSHIHEAWRMLTNEQSLFLTQAVANSNEKLVQLKAPLRWLRELLIESNGMRGSAGVTRRLIADFPSFGKMVAELLSDVDVPISVIRSQLSEATQVSKGEHDYSVRDDQNSQTLAQQGAGLTTTLTHKSSLGEAEFDYDEESDGTKNLFGFALPWLLFRQKNLSDRENVLVIDELDSSLHPKLVEALVEKHLKSGQNSQLIFTTHDTHLMDNKLLRRDQIWMTERDGAGATELRSVYDFAGREGEDIEKRYYEGRYRSLPMVKKA